MLKLSSRWQPLPLLGMMAAALMAGSMAHGQTFSTGAGATASDGKPVSATATFHVTQGNVQIDVQNLIFNPTAVSQNISDLFFTISTPQTIGTLSGTGASGSVASGGAFTSEGTVSVTPAWVMDPFNNTLGFHLDALGGGQPKYTILGLPGAGGLYSNANGSIAGNGTHNPFFVGDVTFNVAIAGIDANTQVTGATFSFGTEPGDNVPGGGGPPQGNMTPEGSSLFLMAPGLLPVVWFGIRRRFAKNV